MNFQEKKERYMNIMYEYQYIFEIKKCCEYTEWITVYKNMTINDLYNNLYTQFYHPHNNKLFLYIMNENGEKKLLIKSDKRKTFHKFYIFNLIVFIEFNTFNCEQNCFTIIQFSIKILNNY